MCLGKLTLFPIDFITVFVNDVFSILITQCYLFNIHKNSQGLLTGNTNQIGNNEKLQTKKEQLIKKTETNKTVPTHLD